MIRIDGIALFALLLCHAAIAAEPSVTFPLQGYFRAGKYLPAHVRSDGSSGHSRVVLAADGTVPTEIEVRGAFDVIVPWLAVRDSIAGARIAINDRDAHTIDSPLHALADDEALVGFAGADADVLKPMLGERKIIGVPLELGQPLAGPIVAWEALDGIVLDAPSAARVTESQLQGLLAAGTAVAIRSDTKPAGRWPWQQHGDYWVLRCSIAGPDSAYNAAAYAPTASWVRGWPNDFRRLVILAAIVFSIVVLAVTLWRSQTTVLVALVLCVSTVGGIVFWRGRQSPAIRASGDVFAVSRDFSQRDRWTYCGVVRSGQQSTSFAELTRPMLGYRAQVEQTALRLICRTDGYPQRFVFHLRPGWSLAFLNRSVSTTRPQLSVSNPVYSPLRPLVEDQYLRESDRLLGQTSAPQGDWPGVVIEGK